MIQKILGQKLLPLVLVLLFCIPVILPYLHEGYFPTHDGEWAVVRLADMFRTLRDLQFPPRYSGALNFGYGYPLFNFAYPMPYFLGILLYIPLQSFVGSIKAIFVSSVFLSAIFMYIASNTLWKSRLAGIFSSIVYIYLPYRMVDLYVRGSIGESVSLALFPLIFYFAIKLFDSPFSRIIVISLSLSIGMLVLSHNIMTVLFMPLLIIFILARIIREKRFDVFQSFFLSIFLGAGISAFFWLVALFEKNNIALSVMPIADRNLYFVGLKELFIPSWGFAPPTDEGGFSYQLGVSQSLIMASCLVALSVSFFRKKFAITPVKHFGLTLLTIYIVYFLMMFSFTSVVWQNVPLLSEINYPWTILSQLGFITALIAGFLISQGSFYKYVLLVLSILAILFTISYASPQSYNNYPDNYYMTNEATTTSSDEYMPVWVAQKPTSHFSEKVEVIEGSASISNIEYNSKNISFDYDAESDSEFRINTIYYPGWRAYLNTVETGIEYDNPNGVMTVKADAYSNKVFLHFDETLLRTLANGLSIISFLVLLFIALRPILLFKK